jgi:hypothetical protein
MTLPEFVQIISSLGVLTGGSSFFVYVLRTDRRIAKLEAFNKYHLEKFHHAEIKKFHRV